MGDLSGCESLSILFVNLSIFAVIYNIWVSVTCTCKFRIGNCVYSRMAVYMPVCTFLYINV